MKKNQSIKSLKKVKKEANFRTNCDKNLELKEKSRKQIALPVLYLLWLVSMVVFFISWVEIISTSASATTTTATAFIISAGAGFWIFVALFVVWCTKISDKKQSKDNRKLIKNYTWLIWTTFVVFFVLLIVISLKIAEKNQAVINNSPKPTPIEITKQTPTPKTTSAPTPKTTSTQNKNATANLIDCTGPDGVVFKTTQKECDDFNAAWGNTANQNNGLVDCKLGNGQVVRVDKNVCDLNNTLEKTVNLNTEIMTNQAKNNIAEIEESTRYIEEQSQLGREMFDSWQEDTAAQDQLQRINDCISAFENQYTSEVNFCKQHYSSNKEGELSCIAAAQSFKDSNVIACYSL